MKKWTWLIGLILVSAAGCTRESKDSADRAGEKFEQGAEKAKQSGADALTTGKVRTAIMTATDVKIEDLNVDTMGGKVFLKGKAIDAKSKQTAEAIAKTQVGNDYQVVNEITQK